MRTPYDDPEADNLSKLLKAAQLFDLRSLEADERARRLREKSLEAWEKYRAALKEVPVEQS